MTDPYTLREQAKVARTAGQHLEAARLYTELFEQYPATCKDWDYQFAITALRKAGHLDEAVTLAQAGLQQFPDSERVHNAYGWALYSQSIKPDDVDTQTRLGAAKKVVEITTQSQYSPYTQTVFTVVKSLNSKGKAHRNHARMLEWLDKLDSAQLDATPKPIHGEHLDELASDLEQWYQLRSDCLLELRRYDECITVCSEALTNLAGFHYDNDLWFRRRRGEAYLAQREPDQALPDFEVVLKRKRSEFWAYHDIAKVYALKEDWSKAREYCALAALAGGDPGFKWKVYYHLARLCLRFDDRDRAAQHLQLAGKVHTESKRKIPASVQEMADELEVKWEDGHSAKQLERQLRPHWESLRPVVATTHQGVISIVHSNGKSGIIKAEDGQIHFFGMKNVDRKLKDPGAGTKVRFNLVPSTNPKTGKEEMHAVDIFSI